MNAHTILRDVAVLAVALFSGLGFLAAFVLAAIGLLWPQAVAVAVIALGLLFLDWRLAESGP